MKIFPATLPTRIGGSLASTPLVSLTYVGKRSGIFVNFAYELPLPFIVGNTYMLLEYTDLRELFHCNGRAVSLHS